MPKFEDPRLTLLNDEQGFKDTGMRRSLLDALEPGETAIARYSVSAHIWVEAVLTDRALLLVKGAVRARTTRVPLPIEVVREPQGTKQGTRVRTPLGVKTLWGSRNDADCSRLCAHAPTAVRATSSTDLEEEKPQLRIIPPSPGRRSRAERRRIAGPKPRQPRRQKARAARVGFAPASTIWDVSHNCIKCGRALTNPNSQRHRVGTDCIKRYGSQARKIANPAYGHWTAKKAKAEADRASQQATYNAEHARAQADYEQALATWREIRSGRSAVSTSGQR